MKRLFMMLGFCLLSAASMAQSQKAKKPSKAVPITLYKVGDPLLIHKNNDPLKYFMGVVQKAEAVAGKPDKFSAESDRANYVESLKEPLRSASPVALPVDCTIAYDPNREEFKARVVLVKASENFGRYDKPLNLMIDSKIISESTYLANNAFGATSTVKKTVADGYYLSFRSDANHIPPRAASMDPKEPEGLLLTAKVPRDLARSTSKSLICMIVFTLEAPFIEPTLFYSAPTRDDPRELAIFGTALTGRIDRLALVDSVTGVVLAEETSEGK